jgi:hypothetical protein
MGVLSEIKTRANRWLAPLNVQVCTLTAERAEAIRLSELKRAGHFNVPAFPTLPHFERCDFRSTLEAVRLVKDATGRFAAPSRNGEFSFVNNYFGSPDAEVAYALAKQLRPGRIVEVGSGNSTRLFREAIRAERLHTELVSIDPFPRVDIETTSDRIFKSRLEQLPASFLPGLLSPGDFLFIDSSHEIRVGNDVLNLLLNVLPSLRCGVVIHLHDIFLPYDYPSEWIIDRKWDQFKEQYLVQALLQDSIAYEVLWPGHYVQRTLPDFADYFSGKPVGRATSLWLRKVS